jgi:cytochrome c oxidase subunit 4
MTDTTPTEAHHAIETAGHDAHPSDGHYIAIALILGALTAAETATYFFDAFDNTTLLLIVLMPIMSVKFFMVAWFFMHLKSDSRLFSKFFVAGIVLAAAVYIIVLLAFDEFF